MKSSLGKDGEFYSHENVYILLYYSNLCLLVVTRRNHFVNQNEWMRGSLYTEIETLSSILSVTQRDLWQRWNNRDYSISIINIIDLFFFFLQIRLCRYLTSIVLLYTFHSRRNCRLHECNLLRYFPRYFIETRRGISLSLKVRILELRFARKPFKQAWYSNKNRDTVLG